MASSPDLLQEASKTRCSRRATVAGVGLPPCTAAALDGSRFLEDGAGHGAGDMGTRRVKMDSGSFKTGSVMVRRRPAPAHIVPLEGSWRPVWRTCGLVAPLRDLQRDHIVVAVHAHLVHGLHMPGLLALEPQLAAGPAEIHRTAQLDRLARASRFHPGEHQHVTGAALPGDHGHEPGGVPLTSFNQFIGVLSAIGAAVQRAGAASESPGCRGRPRCWPAAR